MILAEHALRNLQCLKKQFLGLLIVTLAYMDDLAILYEKLDRQDDAEDLYLKILNTQKHVFGEENKATLGTMTNLAAIYEKTGRLDEAEKLYRRSLEGMRRVLGMDHSWTGYTMNGLAKVLERQGRTDEALALRRELFEIQVTRARLPGASVRVLNSAAGQLLTIIPIEMRDPPLALEFILRANEQTGYKKSGYLDTLALAYHRTGDTAKAIEMQEKALAFLPPGESQSRKDMEARLEEYRRATGAESTTTHPATSRPDHSDHEPSESPSSQPADPRSRSSLSTRRLYMAS